ncbi:hypothetical protein B7R54_13430 [Subtercola boreus]|uniref:HTH hxlR-type domain-containing protein n=1 Tax=Subtercola boreus TaxID=120213 RepID=A0A3E0VNM2_9MICO|nr:hypothetical protein B7R54_13430 [Subtercola boreus]
MHRSLDIVGERWSLLIIRNAFRGQTKFSEFRDSLGAPSDILTARLATLVDAGVLERRAYREPGARERSSYHLTPQGLALKTVLVALQEWGDAYTPWPAGRVSLVERSDTHSPVSLAFVDEAGATVPADDVRLVPGPAARATW